jgi:hypothetical protein
VPGFSIKREQNREVMFGKCLGQCAHKDVACSTLIDLMNADYLCRRHNACAKCLFYNGVVDMELAGLISKPQEPIAVESCDDEVKNSWEDLCDEPAVKSAPQPDNPCRAIIVHERSKGSSSRVDDFGKQDAIVRVYWDGSNYQSNITKSNKHYFGTNGYILKDVYKDFLGNIYRDGYYIGFRPDIEQVNKIIIPDLKENLKVLSSGGFALAYATFGWSVTKIPRGILGESEYHKWRGDSDVPKTIAILRANILARHPRFLQMCYPDIGQDHVSRFSSSIQDVMYWKSVANSCVLRRDKTHPDSSWRLRKTPQYGFATIFHNPRNPAPPADDIWKRLIEDDHKNDLFFRNLRTSVDQGFTKLMAVFGSDPKRGIIASKMDLLRNEEPTERRGERYQRGKLYDMVEFKKMYSPTQQFEKYKSFNEDNEPDSRVINPFDNRRVCEKQVKASLSPEYATVVFHSWETDLNKILETSKLRESKRWKHMHELRAFASRGGVRRSIEKIVSLALYKELMASRYCDTNVNRDSETQRTLFKSASRGLISNILDDRALSLDQKAFVADNTIDLCMAAWNEAVSINKGSMSKNF